MADINKSCKICGNAFITTCHNKAYCSEECAIMGRRELDRFKRMKHKGQSELAKERAAIEREAQKYGMHYGMYVGLNGL